MDQTLLLSVMHDNITYDKTEADKVLATSSE